MFPVSDVIPSRTTPVATITLLAVNCLAFLYELQLDHAGRQALVNSLGVTPASFAWPTLVTSLFLHTGWLHLGANMLCLWLFGDNVEDALGRAQFLLFYFLCGAAAGLAHVAIHPWSMAPMIGASGAIAGAMGAYLVLYPRSRMLTAIFLILYADLIEVPAAFFVAVWFLVQLFSGVWSIGLQAADGTLAFWAHVAGFIAGALCGTYARFGAASLRRYWQ